MINFTLTKEEMLEYAELFGTEESQQDIENEENSSEEGSMENEN